VTLELPGCPYCKRQLRYVANRWFGHSVFECEQCGDFPDFRSSTSSVAIGSASPADIPPSKTEVLPRVLLVDDSDEQRALYEAMLAATARVATASTGEAALKLAAAGVPDVIVLDVMMPGMDGWETCRRLKADPITAGIPIVILTSLDGADVTARAREAGAIAVLKKPCPEARLVLTINAARGPLTS
jgi:CheY-like chemotaxis protein